MERSSFDAEFPARISRRLALTAGVVVALVLLVGGTSLALAARILQNNEAVALEYQHIRTLDELHSAFDDLIFELHQIDATRRLDQTADARLMQDARLMHEEVVRQLSALRDMHRERVPEPEEQVHIGELRELLEAGGAVTLLLVAGHGRLAEADFEWLNRATHEVPRHTEALAASHRSRIDSLLESSQRQIQVIVGLYLGFLVVGVSFVLLVSLAASRGIAAPLRRLAGAAQEIADGRFETRVGIRSANEIGLLAHAFNGMAARLQEHERELRGAQDALEQKVRETQALYRIGTEISRLQQLDRIIQSVVDKARELLRGDAAALCLLAPARDKILAQATSGPPEAFLAGVDGVPRGPLIRPEHARAHLAAPLRLGEELIGSIEVATREERIFTADEADLLAGLATQAAIAIERARLSEEIRGLAAIEERERLAREMHDGLAQGLGLLHLKLHAALACSAGTPGVSEALREMVDITAHVYEDLRQSIFGLRTFVSRGLGLVPTLTEYLHEFSAHSGITVELEASGSPLGPSLPHPRSRPSASSRKPSTTCGSTQVPITHGFASRGRAPGFGW